MNAPTYCLRSSSSNCEPYLGVVRQLADWVLASGELLHPVVDAYAEYVELNGREQRRSPPEYLLEALSLGVMWRARGREALDATEHRRELVTELVRERRAGADARRDGSTAALAAPSSSTKRGRIDPTLSEIAQLLDWMLAAGEYDGELERLDGWKAFLSTTQAATNREILRLVVAFAVRFEATAERLLGAFTDGVDRFLDRELATRNDRQDTLQCSRRRVEYHLNMVGAEILNRAWRRAFLSRRRHVVVLPGCARLRDDSACRGSRGEAELKCTHCTLGCAVSATTRLAERYGAEVTVVMHGSAVARYVEAKQRGSDDIGIIGVACAAGLTGGGWRVRAAGMIAQCVLLNASGCSHWQAVAVPTSFDLTELARILDRRELQEQPNVTPRVA